MPMPKFDLPPIEHADEDLLSYGEVRELFGIRENTTVRRWVTQGLLRRVRTSKASNGWRITASSAKALRTLMLFNSEVATYQEKARVQTMRERKGQDQPKQDEVLLDSEEIIRRYNEGPKAPLPAPQPEQSNFTEGNMSTRQPQRPRQRLGFTTLRGI